jgi:RNA polymerase sigma factor (sigma-70 family)
MSEQQFESFFRMYQVYVRELCVARCRSTGDAADAESTVWYDVYQAFDKFQVEDPRPRLYQLVVWRVRNLYRSGARKYEYATEHDDLCRVLEDAVPQATPESQMQLKQLLEQEPPLERELLFGRFVEGLTWEELATRHQLHRNTISRRTDEALTRLRKRLS